MKATTRPEDAPHMTAEDVPVTAEDALRYRCAHCGAKPNMPCVGRSGQYPHDQRLIGAQLNFFPRRNRVP